MKTVFGLEQTSIGEAYVRTVKHGPYVRYSTTQNNHIDDGLMFWMKKSTPEEIMLSERTADQGTLLHRYFDAIIKQTEFVIPEEEKWVEPVLENFRQFVARTGLKAEHTELCLGSDILGIGGTMDFVGYAKVDDHPITQWILDWKSGGIHDSYNYQLAFYKFLALEHKIINDNYACGIAQFHRDGKEVGFEIVEDTGRYLMGALHTFERWKRDNYEKLRWALAPQELIAEKKKSRGKNRARINEEWKESYMWPWLYRDSIKDAMEFLEKL